MFYIYIFQHKENNKIYVGKTNNLVKRIRRHKLESKNPKTYFHNAINKYGIESFNCFVIEEYENEQECFDAEMFWIEFFRSHYKINGYNLTKGGEGVSGYKHTEAQKLHHSLIMTGRPGTPWSEEQKLKRSIERQGKNSPMFGKTHNQSAKLAIAKAHTGTKNFNTKFTDNDIISIKAEYMICKSYSELGRKYKVSHKTISRIINGLTWKHIK